MFHIRLIIFWYSFLTILTLFSSITLNFIDFLPGVFLIWVILLILIISTKIKVNKNVSSSNDTLFANSANYIYIIIALGFILFFPVYIKFYTGSSILLVFINLFSGVSNYQSYQDYFLNENLQEFNITKLPYIVTAGLLKFLFICSVSRVMGFKKKINIIELTSLLIMVVVTIILAISRGTSFELFELIILLVFTTLLRRRRMELKNWFTSRSLLILTILGVVIMLVFSYNIDTRGEFNCLTKEMCFDETGMLASISPMLGNISFKLSGYFIFGLYLISKTLLVVGTNSLLGFSALLLPKGLSIVGLGSSYSELMCGSVIDCSVAWIPDLLNILNNWGLIGMLFFLFFLGMFSKKIFYQTVNGSIPASVILYFVFLFMISLPVGNFITVSSSNLIAILCSIVIYIFPGLGRVFHGFFDSRKSDC